MQFAPLRRFVAYALVCALPAACMPSGTDLSGSTVPAPEPSPLPQPARFLDRSPGLREVMDPSMPDDPVRTTGLIPAQFLDPRGRPLDQPRHAAIAEAEATYAMLEARGGYAPGTFEAWKARYGFSPRGEGESLDAWRQRIGAVVYYNENELGLGRELGCSTFDDGGQEGLACFVSNYGETFGNRERSMADAVRGAPVRNTVCIAHIPSLPEGSRVQFFVFGASGQRQGWAQLDHLGARPSPYVCTNCHGGEHRASEHLTREARFLPSFPERLGFASAPPYDRTSQEDAMRRLNAKFLGRANLDAPGVREQTLTADQRSMLRAVYDRSGGLAAPGAVATDYVAPAEWASKADDAEIYREVVAPYCMTCHAALGDRVRGAVATPAALSVFVASSVCGTFSMPNAQQTSLHLWRESSVTIGGRSHPSAADALLAWAGKERSSCASLPEVAGCSRNGVADHALCGNASSGQVCLPSGRCGPDLLASPTVADEEPLGYCTLDGLRGCPTGMACRALTEAGGDGWEGGGCYPCAGGRCDE